MLLALSFACSGGHPDTDPDTDTDTDTDTARTTDDSGTGDSTAPATCDPSALEAYSPVAISVGIE